MGIMAGIWTGTGEICTYPTWPRLDLPRVDHLVSQPNPTHLLVSQKI